MAHACPLRFVVERKAIEPSLDPPRYLDELPVPFPVITVEAALLLTPASPESLVLRRVPESNSNLLEIWMRKSEIL